MELKATTNVRPNRMTRKQALDMTWDWAEKQLSVARQIPNKDFSIISLLALIDCFAQADADYPIGGKLSKKAFCNFVLNHSSSYSKILQHICPITLYYDYKDKYNLPSLPFSPGELLPINDDRLQKAAENYLLCLPPDKKADSAQKHQYIMLLYQLRNKLVHEMNYLGLSVAMFSNYPSISCVSRIGIDDLGKDIGIQEQYWALNIPKDFIYQLAHETIFHRLEICKEKDNLPFPLTNEPRKCELSWYDK